MRMVESVLKHIRRKYCFDFNPSLPHISEHSFSYSDEALGRMRDLQCKINDLEEEVVRERSRTHELEQRLNSPPVMSFENIDNLSNISSSPPITAPGFIPNRVFCDNCDVFDEHDTENCPVGELVCLFVGSFIGFRLFIVNWPKIQCF